MKKKFLVIGLGRFGLAVAKALDERGNNVLAIDIDPQRVEKASEFLQYVEICDSSKLDVLEAIDAQSFSTAIVSVGSLQSTFLTVANLSELGIKRVYVRVENEDYNNVLKRLGATDIIIPEESAAISLSHEVVSQNILDYYEINEKYGVVQVLISDNFESKTLIDLDIRNNYDVNIVGIIRKKDFFIPKGVDTINPQDIVLVVGTEQKIEKFEQEINED